jgi:hypothetical protein
MEFLVEYLKVTGSLTCLAIIYFVYTEIKEMLFPKYVKERGNASLPEKEDTVKKIKEIYDLDVEQYSEK